MTTDPTDETRTDAVLIEEIAQADRRAFRALFERYHGRIYGLALRVTGRADKADEVASDTMMAVWRGAEGYEGRAKASTWIFGIAHRTALKSIRQRGVERGKVAVDEAAELADADQVPADERLRHRELKVALAELPEEMRAVMVLTYFGGHTVAEVAEITDLPEGTVKSRMHAARKRLKERLK